MQAQNKSIITVLALSTSIMLSKTLGGGYNVWGAHFFGDGTGIRGWWVLEWFFQALLVLCSPGLLMSAGLIVQGVNGELHFTRDKLSCSFWEHGSKGTPWLSMFSISDSSLQLSWLLHFLCPFFLNNTFGVSHFTSRDDFVPTLFSTTQYFVCSCTFYISQNKPVITEGFWSSWLLTHTERLTWILQIWSLLFFPLTFSPWFYTIAGCQRLLVFISMPGKRFVIFKNPGKK